MKQRILIIIMFSLFTSFKVMAQAKMEHVKETYSPVRKLTIEPAIGMHTNFLADLLLANLVQWNPKKHLALSSHTSYNINNVMMRSFNGISTGYNYSINQKIGVGTSFYSKRSANTFQLMVGVKYTSFNEAMVTAEEKKVNATVTSFSPDYGIMYSLRKGVKKYFFSFRTYVPLYPWPVKDVSINAADGNMNNIALEFGIGMKLQ